MPRSKSKQKQDLYHFGGYATKNGLKCSDGRVINPNAFEDQDGTTVPMVWQHCHNSPDNVLGHAILENRDDGVYAYGIFNDTPGGQNAKALVEHGDIDSLSIHANDLVQKGPHVVHGVIRELSLVLAGANPGARIDYVALEHADGSIMDDEDQAIIHTGLALEFEDDYFEHEDDDDEDMEEDDDEETVQDVFETMDEKQKEVVYALVGAALEEAEVSDEEDDDEEDDDDIEHSNIGGKTMKRNAFDQNGSQVVEKATLTHSQLQEIVEDAKRCGSFKESFLAHAQDYGIENIDYLFPDARNVQDSPDFIKRRTEWVNGVLTGVKKSPFSRIKSMAADITADEARAKGYVKGNLKKEEVFKLLKRTTTPTTIYKKQKLDRDDIIDITDLDVVAWLKNEMRIMLDEEIARAILIGDGRDVSDPDKIDEEHIRPIWTDDDMYAHHVEIASTADTVATMEAIIRASKEYKGTGNPDFYTTNDFITDMLLLKDTTGRKLYNSVTEIESALRVNKLIAVEVMEGAERENEDGTEMLSLIGIMVNLTDYIAGADKGGDISMFDDFDIDYNQLKYLMETRMSGALHKPKSAVVIEKIQV